MCTAPAWASGQGYARGLAALAPPGLVSSSQSSQGNSSTAGIRGPASLQWQLCPAHFLSGPLSRAQACGTPVPPATSHGKAWALGLVKGQRSRERQGRVKIIGGLACQLALLPTKLSWALTCTHPHGVTCVLLSSVLTLTSPPFGSKEAFMAERLHPLSPVLSEAGLESGSLESGGPGSPRPLCHFRARDGWLAF